MKRSIILVALVAAGFAAFAGPASAVTRWIPTALSTIALALPGASEAEQMRIAHAGNFSWPPLVIETDPTPAPAPAPVPVPIPGPIPVVPQDPAPQPPAPVPAEGYERPDLVAAVGLQNVSSVFCRTDAAWPSDSSLAKATAYWTWAGSTITLRTWRCDGIAAEQIGTEAFARGLFVLAHEATHAEGVRDECLADKGGVEKMPRYAAALGFGYAAGAAARDLLLAIFRAKPLDPPYCLGRF